MPGFPHRHLLGIEQLSREDILFLLDEAEPWIAFSPPCEVLYTRFHTPPLRKKTSPPAVEGARSVPFLPVA